jgi:thiosulfate dehydrogenase (quinone) large subunit
MNTSICSCMNPQRLAPALIRWALGILFLVGGVAKLTALGEFVNGYLVPAFSKTFLPSGWVAAYGYALPFVEMALGVLLLIGIWRVGVLLLAGVTFISLAFGQILLQQHTTVANIFLYVLMTALALYFEPACATADTPEKKSGTPSA